jgi:nitrite reductase (NADH) small subunit
VTWIEAGALESIPARGARVLYVADWRIAVFRTSQDEVFALRDSCPHRGGPLSQGIVHGRCVTCPLHDWVIDLSTGLATGPDEGGTPVYETQVRDGAVFIAIPDALSEQVLADADIAAEAG